MTAKKHFTTAEAETIGKELGIKWRKFDVEQFRMGLDVELEHGSDGKMTDVTGDDAMMTGKIALAHLNEFPDYYTRLEKMEAEAERYHSVRGRVEHLGDVAKSEFAHVVDAIQPTIADVGTKLQSVTGIKDEQVAEAQEELTHAWATMQKAFDKVAARVRQRNGE